MSVIYFSAEEIGAFAATCIADCNEPADQLRKLAVVIAHQNAKAYNARYQESEPIADLEELTQAIDYYLDHEEDRLAKHWGPISYNLPPLDGVVGDWLRNVEEAAVKHKEGEQRRREKQEANAASYDVAGQQATFTPEAIEAECQRRGCARLIVAEYHVDESCAYTDYHGHRTARRVVIGYGKGKRENFRQLRKAAASFPPTANMAPGCDLWEVVSKDEDHTIKDKAPQTFRTEQEADAWIAAERDKPREERHRVIKFADSLDGWEVTKRCESIENRENYSMGGGNYLGTWRHRTGWKVRSYSGIFWSKSDPVEVSEAAHPQA